jgi:hypothetical protein
MLIIIFTVLGALLGFWSKFKPDFDASYALMGKSNPPLQVKLDSAKVALKNWRKYVLSALLFAGISYIGLLLIKRFTKRKK